MNCSEERFLIYTAVVILCAAIAAFASVAAGVWTFLQVSVVVELMYLMGTPTAPKS